MSVARVTEISASSTISFEDAVQAGIARATDTLRNVKSAWVQEQSVVVDKGAIAEYRVNMKVTFVLEEAEIAEASEGVVQDMMGFKGRR